jgi:fatty acid/phospholipid biosynthesis enzyme
MKLAENARFASTYALLRNVQGRRQPALVRFIPKEASDQLVILDRKLTECVLQNLIGFPVASVI